MRKNEEETKMRCVDRKGNEIGENAAQGRVLKALYETAAKTKSSNTLNSRSAITKFSINASGSTITIVVIGSP